MTLLLSLAVSGCEIAGVPEQPGPEGGTNPNPDPDPTGETPVVESLTLIDSRIGIPIPGFDPIPNGATLDLATMPPVTMWANVTDGTASVEFQVNGTRRQVENAAPFSIAGDYGGDYFEWTPPMGAVTIEVLAYPGASLAGRPGASHEVTLNIINSNSSPAAGSPVANASRTESVVSDDDEDGFVTVTLDGSTSTDPDGSIVSWEWFDQSGIPTLIGRGETTDVEFALGVYSILLRVTDDGEPGLQSTAAFTLYVQEGMAPPPPPPPPAPGSGDGFASAYPNDVGLGSDPRIVLFEDFEQSNWRDKWRGADKFDLVQVDDQYFGKALRAPCRTNSNGGMDFYKRFDGQQMEMYARFYAMFEPGFDMNDVGKFPGFSSTFDECAWGGRTPGNGDKCWSARGDLGRDDDQGRVPVGTYLYSQDQATTWGDHDHWDQNGDSHMLEPGRWYCLETHVKMDTDEVHGWVEGWIDGELAYSRYVRLSDVPSYIEKFWMNLYHGGARMWPKNQHVFFTHVAVATERIGPMFSE